MKLTTEQNLALRDKSLEEKLNLLHLWRKQELITLETFNCLSNKWINRESRRISGTSSPLRKKDNENAERSSTSCTKSIIEGEMQYFLEYLRKQLNEYIAKRCKESVQLTNDEISKFNKYLTQYLCYRSKINRLLIVGLRFPDKRLNEICYKYISEHRKSSHFQDFTFWGLLWEDGNLVPLDAVRLMLIKKNKQFSIDPYFDRHLIRNLIPAIEFQRDKEIQRLKWAQSLDGEEYEREVARKTRRLEAFNILLNAAAEYIE